MIIVGYQGIGKSTLAKNDLKYIDLESSNTFIDNKKPDGWEVIYVNFALSLSNQGYNVFLSSHSIVRQELIMRNIKFISIFPCEALKKQWIQKLQDRYNTTKLNKDFKALENAKNCFINNVRDIKKDSKTFYEITDINYSLKEIVKKYETNE